MGFDVSVQEACRLVTEFERARSQVPADDPELLHGELEILKTFADLAELSRNWPAREVEELEEEEGERVRNPREHLRSYLHSLDIERESLPQTFRARLSRALARYGVHDLERGPELEEAVTGSSAPDGVVEEVVAAVGTHVDAEDLLLVVQASDGGSDD